VLATVFTVLKQKASGWKNDASLALDRMYLHDGGSDLLLKQYCQQAEQNYPRAKKVFSRLLTVHLLIWTAYPIVWILASTGFNVIDGTTESACYTILDVAAKVGFGFLALNSLKQLEQAEQVTQYPEGRSLSRG
jgi:bacteriorhodopsin